MPFYEKGNVRIRYEEAGSGFPLLVISGGGLNSVAAYLATRDRSKGGLASTRDVVGPRRSRATVPRPDPGSLLSTVVDNRVDVPSRWSDASTNRDPRKRT